MRNDLYSKKCTEWIKDIFRLEKADNITLEQIKVDQNQVNLWTKIVISSAEQGKKEYIIKKPLEKITKKHIRRLANKAKIETGKMHPVWGPLFRFLGWWFAFTGIYTMFAVCPFCGQAGCAVGAGSAGVIGGFFAFLMQFGKTILNSVKSVILKLVQK